MDDMKKRTKFVLLGGILEIILIAIDQVTKYLAYTFLRVEGPKPIIPDVFELQYLENQSAAFGIDPVSLLNKLFHWFEEDSVQLLRVKMVFFSILTIAVVVVIIIYLLKIPDMKRLLPLKITALFFVAGAIGNLIDRLVNNYVIDFFYFKLINFPIFNVADIYVTCSAVVLVILAFFYKDEDYKLIFPAKKAKNK